jgi:hypothetical protein
MNKKIETLKSALLAREDEVLHYQINIDNYAAAMKKISEQYSGDDDVSSAMREFYKQIKSLHDTSVIEQAKAKLMLDVIREQVEVM